MGQIVIDIPQNKTVHYEVSTAQESEQLIQILDGIFLIDNPELTDEDLEDIQDGLSALAALKRNNFVRWEDVRHRL